MKIRVPNWNRDRSPSLDDNPAKYSCDWWDEVKHSGFDKLWVFTGSNWPITLHIVSWENIADLHHEKSLDTEFPYQRVKNELRAQLKDIRDSAIAVRFALKARIRHYREEKDKDPIAAVRICKKGLERLDDLWKIHKYAHKVTKEFEKKLDRLHTNGKESFDFRSFTFEGYTIESEIEEKFNRIVEEVGSVLLREIDTDSFWRNDQGHTRKV
eukprot:scaffold8361_cov195-Cylindrotheca_fusiformis.AAC.1